MTCQNREHQKFCAQAYRHIPCCKDIDKREVTRDLFFLDNPGETGLIIQLFELGRLFAEKKIIKFHSQGICMYPCIIPGDVLRIEPRSANEIRIGDVAVYKRCNRLFAHRTINKGQKNNLNYIITRPDTARYGNDGPSFDKDILGIVSNVERKNRILDTARKDYGLGKQLILSFRFKAYCFRQYLFGKIVYIVTFIQQFKAYKKIAGFLFV